MKYIDTDLIKSTQSLYSDIDSCIDELLKARIEHKQENEGKALFRMEGLMVATLQQLDCIIGSLQQEQLDFPTTDEQMKEFLAAHPKIKVPEKYKNPDWLFKKQEQKEEPDKSLEEAITSFFDNFPGLEKINWDWRCDTLTMASDAIRTFAKHFFELGKKDMKEQMLKDAVEGEVGKDGILTLSNGEAIDLSPSLDKIAFGLQPRQKVRIVVLKEEE